jgi:hypothetical protein
VESANDGSELIAATTSAGSDVPVACMPTATAQQSLKAELSMAAIQPVADGVVVLLAVPSARVPRQMKWIDLGSTAISSDGQFSLWMAHVSVPPGQIAVASPSEQQLAQLIGDGLKNGTTTVTGIGPDVLQS